MVHRDPAEVRSATAAPVHQSRAILIGSAEELLVDRLQRSGLNVPVGIECVGDACVDRDLFHVVSLQRLQRAEVHWLSTAQVADFAPKRLRTGLARLRSWPSQMPQVSDRIT